MAESKTGTGINAGAQAHLILPQEVQVGIQVAAEQDVFPQGSGEEKNYTV